MYILIDLMIYVIMYAVELQYNTFCMLLAVVCFRRKSFQYSADIHLRLKGKREGEGREDGEWVREKRERKRIREREELLKVIPSYVILCDVLLYVTLHN